MAKFLTQCPWFSMILFSSFKIRQWFPNKRINDVNQMQSINTASKCQTRKKTTNVSFSVQCMCWIVHVLDILPYGIRRIGKAL